MIRFYIYLSKAVIITFLGLVHMSPATRDDHLSEIHASLLCHVKNAFQVHIGQVRSIELLDIECALCHVIGVQFDNKKCPYKSAILDFLQKLSFPFAQNVLGRANFALINPPFCGDNFLTDTI